MKDEDRRKIEDIMAGMRCPKNFRCTDNGFEHLCQSKDFGLDNYLEYLEKDSSRCSFVLSFGNGFLCHCPLRVFLAKKLKK